MRITCELHPRSRTTMATFSACGRRRAVVATICGLLLLSFGRSSIADTTFEKRVVANSDDMEERSSTGAIDSGSSDLELAVDTDTTQTDTVGMRFTTVTIPRGATITNAYIQFTADETNSAAVSLTIRGQAADNPATFTTTTYDITSRATTSSSVAWSPPAWNTVGEAGVNQRTPNISTIIQEIVNRSGWASNNSVVIIVTGTGKRTAEAYESGSATAALLHVEYKTALHWKLDETSGTTATDASGGGNTGTVVGTASWISGTPRHRGFDFNGSTKIERTTLLDSPTNFTLACWARIDASGTSGADAVSVGDYITLRVHQASGGGPAAVFHRGSSAYVQAQSSTNYIGTGWHHFAATFDDTADSLKLYIDGVLAATTSTTYSVSWSGLGTNTVVGAHGNGGSGYGLDGALDDVRVYGRALTAAEIVELYGLVGYWKLNETSGTTAADSSGIGNNGTVNGTATWTSAIHDNGFSADYTNGEDYIQIPNSTSLENVQENSYSLAAWFKPTNLPPGTGSANNAAYRIVGKAGWHLGLVYDYSGYFFTEHWLGTTPDWYGAGAWYANPPGKWYHVAGVVDRDAGTIKFYLDGSLIETTAFTAGSTAYEYGTEPWRVGISYPAATDWGHAARGVIDDVRIYNRAIMPDEVAKLAGFIGHWKMNEGTGTTAADSSALANNATLSGGASWTTDCAGNNNALLTNGTGGIAATGSKVTPPDKGTVAFWMRSTGAPASTARIMGLGGDWEIRQINTGLVISDLCGDGSTTIGTTTPLTEVGRWYHVAITFDSADDTYAIYVDGQLEKSGTNPSAMSQQSAAVLSFGTRTGSTEYWSGALRDVRVYNRKLFPFEIARLHGLLGRWKLVEASGTGAADNTLFVNNGTYTNGVSLASSTTVPGTSDISAKFDGTDDFVSVPNESDYDVTGPLTVAAWVRADTFTGTHREFVSKGGYAWRLRYRPDLSQVSFKCTGLTTDEVLSSGSLLPNRWYHVAGVYTGSSLQLYINGALNNSASTSGSIGTNDYVVNIGRNSEQTGREFDGAIYDARVYNRALCPTEISQLYGSAFSGVTIIKWEEIQ